MDFFSKATSVRIHARLLSIALWCFMFSVHAQTVASLSSSVQQGVQWSDLSVQNQATLAPLQSSWQLLSAAHQRKWLVLAKKFPNMSAAEQEKLHGRMLEWAALKPKDRELARLNFAETKKLSPQERAANWEAYQALGEDDRKQLAANAVAKKAMGGARSIKLDKNNKLSLVTTTRNAPESLRALIQIQAPIHPITLLPAHSAAVAPLEPSKP